MRGGRGGEQSSELKTRKSPLKKKGHDPSGVLGGVARSPPRTKEGNHHRSPLPAPPLPPPAAAPAVRSARFSPLYSEPTSCASRRHRRRCRRETGRRGREGRKGRGQRWASLSARHRESRVRRRAGAEDAARRHTQWRLL